MFSLKQKGKALGQKAINPVSKDTTNSTSISNASAQPLLQQQSVYQQASSEIFDMEFEVGDDDAEHSSIPANTPSSSASSTTERSTTRQLPTKPIDIKYFVPKNIEPEGLSQSVIISDHDYIHRQLVKRYKMNKAAESTSQSTTLHQETIQEPSNEDLDYLSTDNDYSEEDSLSGAAVTASRLFSKSVPLLSSMSNYPRFAWSAITPPDQEHKTKNNTCSPLFPIKEDQNSSVAKLQLYRDDLQIYLDQDRGVNVEERVVPTDDQGLREWREAANECYGEVSVEERRLFDSRLCTADLETPWDRAHRNKFTLERLKKNEFIHVLFRRYSVPMKVTNIAQNARFKQIQHHLHNPNILYLRYIRNTQTVFAIFRRYTEMMKVIDRLNCTQISGKTIVCRPSSFTEYDKACEAELKKKFNRKKMRAAKKNGKNNKKAKNCNSKYRKPAAPESPYTNSNAKQQYNSKQRRKQSRLKKKINNHSLSSPVYYYPCYCVECTNSFLYFAKK